MSELVVLVPALARPHNVVQLLDSIEQATPGARTLFICDHGDVAEIEAVSADGRAHLDICTGGYAAKINRGIAITAEPLVFLGADDLRFHPGWLEAATRLLDPAEVVGVNDLLPRRRVHTTHFLVSRGYAARGTIDGHPGVLSEAYEHNFVDDELIATAKRRGIYAYAEDAHVEHLHPMGGQVRIDETYRRGFDAMRRDRRVFQSRRALWM